MASRRNKADRDHERAAPDDRRQRREVAFPGQLRAPARETIRQGVRPRPGPGGAHRSPGLPRPFVVAKPERTVVPEHDLALEPRGHLRFHPVDLREAAGADLPGLVRRQMRAGVDRGHVFEIPARLIRPTRPDRLTRPDRFEPDDDRRTLVVLDRAVVEIGGGAGVPGARGALSARDAPNARSGFGIDIGFDIGVGIDLHESKLPGDDSRMAGLALLSVPYRDLEMEQRPDRLALAGRVALVHQHRAFRKHAAVAFEDEIDGRIEQGMTGRETDRRSAVGGGLTGMDRIPPGSSRVPPGVDCVVLHADRVPSGTREEVGEPCLQPLAAAAKALVDRGGRGGETALEDLQGEADVPLPLLVAGREALRAVHLLAHVVGDRGVEGGFAAAQRVVHGMGAPLREQRAAVEAKQLLLGEPSQQIARIPMGCAVPPGCVVSPGCAVPTGCAAAPGCAVSPERAISPVHAIPEAALEAVRVEQGHEELEVFLLAVVRGCGHEQEMAAAGAEKSAQPIAFRVPDLRAEEARGHAVRLVAYHQIPFLRRFEAAPEVFASAQHVEPGDQVAGFGEGIAAGPCCFDPLSGQEVEGEAELRFKLVLPLLHQAAGGDDEAAFQIALEHQLPDEQAGHDGLARAGVVGEQEAQRLARQHLAVDRGDLVRQGFDAGGVDRDVGYRRGVRAGCARLPRPAGTAGRPR